MRVAFVGTLLDPRRVQQYSGASVAGNKYQFGMISEFAASGVNPTVFTVPPVASFPRDRRLAVGPSAPTLSTGDVRAVPFLNLLGLKQATIALGLLLRLLGWAWETRKERQRAFLVYNGFSFMAGPVLLARRLTGVPAVIIVADLPPAQVRGAVHRWEQWFQTHKIAAFDALIHITPEIGRDFAPDLPALVVEGGTSGDGVDGAEGRPLPQPSHGKVIVFSGALDENSAIDHLLEAFALIPDRDVTLRILGKGLHRDAVVRAAAKDARIDYLGYVDNELALATQRDADVLVSPRLPDGYTTRYSFPSKIMEYLSTGNPVVSHRLEGMPEEYLRFLHVPAGTDASALAAALVEALRPPRRREEQLAFVSDKRWSKQSAKVVEFMREVVGSNR